MKPDNFLIGGDRQQGTIYVLDFGLAKLYRDPKTGKHISFRDNKRLTGTARYASIPTHTGFEQGRRDDLEGICYIMLYFIKGHLPWQGLPAINKEDKYRKIMNAKIENNSEILTKGLPSTSTKTHR
jgi:serine/threonine protein kinase